MRLGAAILLITSLRTGWAQPGNQRAAELGRRSPMVQSALNSLVSEAKSIKDPNLRKETLDAIQNPRTCIQHRANLADREKHKILQALAGSGLLDPKDDAAFPGGWMAGVFPPVADDGGPCPHLPQPFFAAPGGVFGDHHSYPGGLAIHEANNQIAALNLAEEYGRMYGPSPASLPAVQPRSARAAIAIETDWLRAAPAWHDWAKTIVFQWNSDGSESPEMRMGGNGATDNYGAAGDSRTGAHHLLSLAEVMKRGLAPGFVITQASAHSVPSQGNEYKVVNWLRTAAAIARIDPVQKGYLMLDAKGQPRLPALRKLGSVDLWASSQVNLLPEYVLHNLSDADYSFSGPAVTSIDAILRDLAGDFGFDPKDRAKYNNGFRNRVLSFLTGERLFMIYSQAGRAGVRTELQKARDRSVF